MASLGKSWNKLLSELKKRTEFTIALILIVALISFAEFLPASHTTSSRLMGSITQNLSIIFLFVYNAFILGGFILLALILALWFLRRKYEKLVSYVLATVVVLIVVHWVYIIAYPGLIEKQRHYCVKRAEKIITYLENYRKEKGCYPEKFDPSTIAFPGVLGVEYYYYWTPKKKCDVYKLEFTQGIGIYGFKWYDTIYWSDGDFAKHEQYRILYDVSKGWKDLEREWHGPGFNF